MIFKYEGKDITEFAEIKELSYVDSEGNEADSISLLISNNEEWRKWEVETEHIINVADGGFKSGDMFVDEFSDSAKEFVLKAISLRPEMRTSKNRVFEKISFMNLATSILTPYGFTVDFLNVQNNIYPRLEQKNTSDIEFLTNLCIYEGLNLKLMNGKATIYNQLLIEAGVSVMDFYEGDVGYRFNTKTLDIYGGIQVSGNGITFEINIPGSKKPKMKKKGLPLNSIAEAERYSKNLLRNANRFENTGLLVVEDIITSVAAGNCITLHDFGRRDGKWYVYKCVYDFIEKYTRFYLLRPIGGY